MGEDERTQCCIMKESERDLFHFSVSEMKIEFLTCYYRKNKGKLLFKKNRTDRNSFQFLQFVTQMMIK